MSRVSELSSTYDTRYAIVLIHLCVRTMHIFQDVFISLKGFSPLFSYASSSSFSQSLVFFSLNFISHWMCDRIVLGTASGQLATATSQASQNEYI